MAKTIYLLIGDPLLIDQRCERMKKTLQKDVQGEVHFDTLYLSDKSIRELLVLSKTLPFLSAAQCFRIKEAELLKKDEVEQLEAFFLTGVPAHTYFIFESRQLAQNADLVKVIQKFGEVARFESGDKGFESEQYIREKLRGTGKTIEPYALKRLAEQMGQFPSFLDTVLEQLITYTGDKTQIDEAMVEAFEEDWGELNLFHLLDAIGQRDLPKSISMFRRFLEESDDDLISLMGLLHWQLRRYWMAKALLSQNVSENAVLQRLKINPRQSRFFLNQLKLFPLSLLEQMIEDLFHIDWRIKTGRAQGAEVFEMFLAKMAS